MKILQFAAIVVIGGLASGSALARPFTGTLVERTHGGQFTLRWDKDGPVDVYVAAKPDAPAAKRRKLADNDADGSFNIHLPGVVRPYFVLKSESDGSEIRLAERLLPLQGGSNFRDVGGYPAADGKHVRWGLIYRSGGMPMLTPADYRYLSKLGIVTICDLRSKEESEVAPTNWKAIKAHNYIAPSYGAEKVFGRLVDAHGKAVKPETIYRDFPALLQPHLKQIFATLLAGGAPLAFNCSAGQDRTGFATAMILSALGVPRDVIYADYMLSTGFRRPENEMAKASIDRYAERNMAARFYQQAIARSGGQALKPSPLVDEHGAPQLKSAFDEIENRWGSVDRYLDKGLGIGPDEIARLRTLYLQ